MSESKIYGMPDVVGSGGGPAVLDSYIVYDPVTDRLIASKAIATTLSSLYLGDLLKMHAAGEQMFFKNMESKINFWPAWNAQGDHSTGVDGQWVGPVATTRQYGPYIEDEETHGLVHATAVIPYESSAPITENHGLYRIQVIAGQTYVGRLRLHFYYSPSNIEMFNHSIDVDCVKGDALDFYFDRPRDALVGDTLQSHIHLADGSEFLVMATADDINVAYKKSSYRTFIDAPLATESLIHDALLGEDLGSLVMGEVEYHVDLPLAFGANGDIYRVNKRTANYWTLGMTARHLAGYYESDGTNWNLKPNAALPVYKSGDDDATTTNYRHFTPADIASLGGSGGGGNGDNILSPDTLKEVKVTDTYMYYNDGTRNRVEINASGSMLVSPNGVKTLIVDNNGAYYNGAPLVTSTHEHEEIRAIIGNAYVTVNGGNIAGWRSGVARWSMNGSNTTLLSPGGSGANRTRISDSSTTHRLASVTRYSMNSTDCYLKSPNGLQTLSVSNGGGTINGSRIMTESEIGVTTASLVAGVVPEAQLPAYVDDVLEKYLDVGDTKANGYDAFYDEVGLITKVTESAGIIYIDITSGGSLAYRWTGTVNAQISSGLVIGETSATAYRGDRGALAYTHSLDAHDYSASTHDHDADYSDIDHTHTLLVEEHATLAALITSNPQLSGVIHITLNDDKMYRYSGVAGVYDELSAGGGATNWSDNGSNVFLPTGDSIGLGTSTPNGAAIHVKRNVGAAGDSIALRMTGGDGVNHSHYLSWYKSNDTTRRGWLGFGSTADEDKLALYNDTGDTSIGVNAGGEITLEYNANTRVWVHINSTMLYSPDNSKNLYVSNTGVFITGSVAVTSDERLKDNMEPLDDSAIDFINGLEPISYNYKNDPDVECLGFSAQKVEALGYTNGLVKEGSEDDMKHLAYTEIIAPMVAYIQVLEKRLSILEQKI